jgi:spore coat protein U-like protein
MPLNRRCLLAPVLALSLLTPDGPARAACKVKVSGVAFGVIDVTRDSRGEGNVRVTCDATTSYEIAIAGGAFDRQMAGPGGRRLDYYLSPDQHFSDLWGDDGGVTVGGTSAGTTPRDFTIYGIVPEQSGTPAGSYADQLTVTLRF